MPNIGGTTVGPRNPCYIVADLGVNHNGELSNVEALMRVARKVGCDAVKFQKRDPDLSTPKHLRNTMRETPWGLMTYYEYRHKVELSMEAYESIDTWARQLQIHWFASVWDMPSLHAFDQFDMVAYKIPSARLTDHALLEATVDKGKPVVLSTGMSTWSEIRCAAAILDRHNAVLLHCTSIYPCPAEKANLRVMEKLATHFGMPVGYSGHEPGLQISFAAAALGACMIERHVTLDRCMWGSDHAASLEPEGMRRLVRDIRIIEKAMGCGTKTVYPEELDMARRLRISPCSTDP